MQYKGGIGKLHDDSEEFIGAQQGREAIAKMESRSSNDQAAKWLSSIASATVVIIHQVRNSWPDMTSG